MGTDVRLSDVKGKLNLNGYVMLTTVHSALGLFGSKFSFWCWFTVMTAPAEHGSRLDADKELLMAPSMPSDGGGVAVPQ